MSWFMPAFKAILPHLGTITSTVAPVFTRKPTEQETAERALLAQQIAELQAASVQNAEQVRALAAQLQNALASLEQAAGAAQRRLQWLAAGCIAALLLSLLALALALR